MDIKEIALHCKTAGIFMSALSSDIKNAALRNIIRALEDNMDRIIEANKKDLAKAQKDNLEAPLMKRLKFDQAKLIEACDGLSSLITLQDPVGMALSATELDKGLNLYKVSRPIGVIGVIFESRPDALVQIAALCLKSGNSVLLKGGKEAFATNQIVAAIILMAGMAMWRSANLANKVSPTIITVVQKIFGILLGALAIEFVVSGIRESFNLIG